MVIVHLDYSSTYTFINVYLSISIVYSKIQLTKTKYGCKSIEPQIICVLFVFGFIVRIKLTLCLGDWIYSFVALKSNYIEQTP